MASSGRMWLFVNSPFPSSFPGCIPNCFGGSPAPEHLMRFMGLEDWTGRDWAYPLSFHIWFFRIASQFLFYVIYELLPQRLAVPSIASGDSPFPNFFCLSLPPPPPIFLGGCCILSHAPTCSVIPPHHPSLSPLSLWAAHSVCLSFILSCPPLEPAQYIESGRWTQDNYI